MKNDNIPIVLHEVFLIALEHFKKTDLEMWIESEIWMDKLYPRYNRLLLKGTIKMDDIEAAIFEEAKHVMNVSKMITC